MDSISNNVKTVRVLNATAAGYTTANGTILDRTGFDTIRFVVLFGAISADPIIRVHMLESDNANMSGSSIVGDRIEITDAGADNRAAILERVRPTKRYVQLQVLEVAGTAAIDGAIAELGGAANVPTADDATVQARSVQAAA